MSEEPITESLVELWDAGCAYLSFMLPCGDQFLHSVLTAQEGIDPAARDAVVSGIREKLGTVVRSQPVTAGRDQMMAAAREVLRGMQTAGELAGVKIRIAVHPGRIVRRATKPRSEISAAPATPTTVARPPVPVWGSKPAAKSGSKARKQG